jgi:hypothetical protein
VLPLEFEGMGVKCEIPRSYMNQKIVMRGFWTAYDSVSSLSYCPDLPVGGILDIEIFTYPEIPK